MAFLLLLIFFWGQKNRSNSSQEMSDNVFTFFYLFQSNNYDKFKALGNMKGLQYDCRVDPPFVGYISLLLYWLTCL